MEKVYVIIIGDNACAICSSVEKATDMVDEIWKEYPRMERGILRIEGYPINTMFDDNEDK